jgi:ech hydrogenase subunit A
MWIMLAVIVLLPLFFFGKTKKKIVPIYLGGANEGDDLTFKGAMEKEVPVSLRNWYMEKYFGEYKMNVIGVVSTSVIIAFVFAIVAVIGGGLYV